MSGKPVFKRWLYCGEWKHRRWTDLDIVAWNAILLSKAEGRVEQQGKKDLFQETGFHIRIKFNAEQKSRDPRRSSGYFIGNMFPL